MSLFFGDYRVHRLCVFPISECAKMLTVYTCKRDGNCIQLPINVYIYKWDCYTFHLVNSVTVHLPDNVGEELCMWRRDFHYKNCMGVKY